MQAEGEEHDYFTHWMAAHKVVGLCRTFDDGVCVIASLTPIKVATSKHPHTKLL